jgi:hypothetical protein
LQGYSYKGVGYIGASLPNYGQRVKKREEKTQIFGFWAGQSGQIFSAGYILALKSSHRWQHLWAKVKI